MATKNIKTQLRYKITSKFEINKYDFNFCGNQSETMRLSIFILQYYIKKQNKSNINKYTKQFANTKPIY